MISQGRRKNHQLEEIFATKITEKELIVLCYETTLEISGKNSHLLKTAVLDFSVHFLPSALIPPYPPTENPK